MSSSDEALAILQGEARKARTLRLFQYLTTALMVLLVFAVFYGSGEVLENRGLAGGAHDDILERLDDGCL